MTMSYSAVHYALKTTRGPAKQSQCPCGKPAEHWAYQHTGVKLFDEKIGRWYSEDLNDYTAMCRSCHTLLDHQYDPAWRESRQKHMAALGKTPKPFAVTSAAGKLGGPARAARLRTDPVMREAHISMLKHQATRRVECLACGMVSTPAGIGRHQQISKHEGRKELVPNA